MATAKELSALEDQRCAAMVKGDADALGKLFDDALVWTHSSAKVDSKESFLAALKGGTRYIEIKRVDEKIRIHGSLAVITGIAEMKVELQGEPRQLRNRYTDVWVQRDGTWKMTAWQSTAAPA
jgi:hypothetical protein